MAVGLPAAVLAQVLAPAHFAAEDTRTPVRAAAGSLLLNLVLIPLLIGPLAEAGIALAGSVAAWAYAGLLAFTLPRAGRLAALPELRRGFGRVVAATAAMVALIAALRPSLAGLPAPAALAVLVGGGGLAYLLVAAALGALRDLRPACGRLDGPSGPVIHGRRTATFPPYPVV
jgi:putative peptidoglycan lipid II flippase